MLALILFFVRRRGIQIDLLTMMCWIWSSSSRIILLDICYYKSCYLTRSTVEVVNIRNMILHLASLGYPITDAEQPSPLYNDNEACVKWCHAFVTPSCLARLHFWKEYTIPFTLFLPNLLRTPWRPQPRRLTTSRPRDRACLKFFFPIGRSGRPTLYLVCLRLAATSTSFRGQVYLAGSYERSYGGYWCMILLPVTSLTTLAKVRAHYLSPAVS